MKVNTLGLKAVFAFTAVFGVLMSSSAEMFAEDLARAPWIAPAHMARKKNPIAPNELSRAAGKAVYSQQCLDCHGASGKGDAASAVDLNPRPRDLTESEVGQQSDGALFWKISTGRKPMPAFDGEVSDQDRWNVVNYLRTLEGSPTSRPTTEPSDGGQ
jgi:mono/diheme cytochrome c family protein